jgi:hypothetical protein
MMQQTQGVQIRGRDPDIGATLTQDGAKQRLDVSTGSSSLPGFNIPPFDAYYIAHTTAYIDTITYYNGAALLNTVTATYADMAKTDLISAVKT